MRLVQPGGSIFDADADRDPETMAAAQVSFGTLGVISTCSTGSTALVLTTAHGLRGYADHSMAQCLWHL
jgi:hypothetical protein